MGVRFLVVGTAPALAEDLERVRGIRFDKIYGANWTPIKTGIIPDVWVTGHAEWLPEWQEILASRGVKLPEVVASITNRNRMRREAHVDRWIVPRWPDMPEAMRFDSGLLTTRMALDDGAAQVVTVGIRCDRSGNLNGVNAVGHNYGRYRPAWMWAAEHKFCGRVRAVGGWLERLLGGIDGLDATAT